MFIPISHDLAGASTDEFDIQLEDAVPREGPANAGPPREVLVIVPDGVGYALDRHSYPGALSLRIFVEATR